MKTLHRALVLGLLATSALSSAALAEYPERPVTFLEPWPPGDVDDQLLRIIAEAFTTETGVPGKVVNRPGGFGVEGAQALSTSAADGYTIGNLLIDMPTSYVIQDLPPTSARISRSSA